MRKDSNHQQPYVEIDSWVLDAGMEHIRLTYIASAPYGPAVRIQVRQTDGHLRMGPEIDVEKVNQFIGALQDLMEYVHREGGNHG